MTNSEFLTTCATLALVLGLAITEPAPVVQVQKVEYHADAQAFEALAAAHDRVLAGLSAACRDYWAASQITRVQKEAALGPVLCDEGVRK